MNPTLYYLCGLPGSGKTKYAQTILLKKNPDMAYLSSDDIRQELCGNENDQTKNKEVFELLHKRLRVALTDNRDVIYDATNISSKRRIAFLNSIKDIPCKKVCIILATPYGDCLSNNQKRERVVPEEVIKRMLMSWNTPYYFEGWDEIHLKYSENIVHVLVWDWIVEPFWRGFDQCNSHHRLPLGIHMEKTYDYLFENYSSDDYRELRIAGAAHDRGKPYVQSFYNAKGELTEEAHYYQHECVGAYNALFYDYDPSVNPLLVSVLINLHMRPYFWNKKARKRSTENYGVKNCIKWCVHSMKRICRHINYLAIV